MPQSPVVTLVIYHPRDARSRERMFNQIEQVMKLYGGRVTARAGEDAISFVELAEELLDAETVEKLRHLVADRYAGRYTLKA